MRNTVRFQSDAFYSTEEKEYFINPTCFGDDLLHWLRPRLEALGYRVDELLQEDWGWVTGCARDGVTHMLAVGWSDAWQICLERQRSMTDRLLGRNAEIEPRLARDLHGILASHPGIREIEWSRMDSRGRETDEAPEPS